MNPPPTDTAAGSAPRLSEMHVERPELDDLERRYDALEQALDAAADTPACLAVLADWDALRRESATWNALTVVRFRQDTRDERARADKDHADVIGPRLRQRDADLQRRWLDGPHAAALAEHATPHVLDLWRADAATTTPSVSEQLVAEARLATGYTRLTGGASVAFRGRPHSLAELRAYRGVDDRELREAAERARWGWLWERHEALDDLFDELVGLRTAIGRGLGHADFVPVGYARKRRTDYDRHDVAAFRRQVVDEVVPLATRLRQRQADAHGLDRLRVWDEAYPAGGASPEPRGDLDAAADGLFAATLPELHGLYRDMRAADLLDLRARDGKAPGGFCTSFPRWGLPFIFANWNGTHDDARVFTHEMGHAFQRASCRDHQLLDTMSCTSETAEIHSMSLEFLTWPEMERFFGDDADHFRRVHLSDQLTFLPYAALVDHFQHVVYDEPDMTPAQRAAAWLELEAVYLPWRDAGGIEQLASGRAWQHQLHVYLMPFYYIDYALALTCALQLWDRSRSDREGAWSLYHDLCRRGGRQPFRRLLGDTGLLCPFDAGSLTRVLQPVRAELDLD